PWRIFNELLIVNIIHLLIKQLFCAIYYGIFIRIFNKQFQREEAMDHINPTFQTPPAFNCCIKKQS
ncbi:hypothetical protein HMPREF1981_01461, partial [Bacteroides pyogenes F0041]